VNARQRNSHHACVRESGIERQLQPEFSASIPEWQVFGDERSLAKTTEGHDGNIVVLRSTIGMSPDIR